MILFAEILLEKISSDESDEIGMEIGSYESKGKTIKCA